MANEPEEARHYFSSQTGADSSSKPPKAPPEPDVHPSLSPPEAAAPSDSAPASQGAVTPPTPTSSADRPSETGSPAAAPPATGADATGETEDWDDYHRHHPEGEDLTEYHHDDDYHHHHPEPAPEPEPGPAAAVAAVVKPRPGGREGPPGTSGVIGADQEEDGGGPVKTFLEHLEDLRWVLIKCVSSVLIAMIVCLVGANWVVGQLMRPLNEAKKKLKRADEVVTFFWGTNLLWQVPLKGTPLQGLLVGTNPVQSFQLVPVPVEGSVVLTLQPVAADPEADLMDPRQPQIQLVSLGPLSPFVVAMKLAIFGGLGLASPFLFYFIGDFVVPALRRKERKYLFQALGVGSLLFVLGVLFCYFVLVPVALYAAVNFAKEYISFVVKFMLGMGVGFELPVVLLTLVRIGLLDSAKLQRMRPYMVVILLVLAAVLTPPDPGSMFLMAVPLLILYEFTVLVARFWERRRPAD
jgi:sec-independent protein translocase protein TatC